MDKDSISETILKSKVHSSIVPDMQPGIHQHVLPLQHYMKHICNCSIINTETGLIRLSNAAHLALANLKEEEEAEKSNVNKTYFTSHAQQWAQLTAAEASCQ
jgi:hypothetical protein